MTITLYIQLSQINNIEVQLWLGFGWPTEQKGIQQKRKSVPKTQNFNE